MPRSFSVVSTLVLLIAPVTRLLSAERDEWIKGGLLLACLLGTVGTALALRRFAPATSRHLPFCVATAGLPPCALILLQADASRPPSRDYENRRSTSGEYEVLRRCLGQDAWHRPRQ